MDGGKQFCILKTSDSFYHAYSGYKVIATIERLFYHKQLNGFKTVTSAKKWWEGQKKKHTKQSWVDSRKPRKKTLMDYNGCA